MNHSALDRARPPVRTIFLVLGAVALVALVLTTAIPPRTKFLGLLNNAGHAPIFGALAFLLLHLIVGRRPHVRLRDFVATFLVVVLLGVAVEVVQYFIGRGAEAGDVLMDASGAGFVLFLLAFLQLPAGGLGRFSGRRNLLIAGMLASAMIVAAPLAECALAYQRRAAIFPEIVRFDPPIDRYFMLDDGVETQVERLPAPWRGAAEAPAVRVELARPDTPGLRVFEPKPDWRGYSVLRIGLVNPGDATLRLVVRVHDAHHDQQHNDRFNRAFALEGQSRRVLDIPLADIENAPRDRQLDLSHVAAIGIFERSRPAPVGAVFYLTRIWLE